MISHKVPQAHRENIFDKGMASFTEGEPIFNLISHFRYHKHWTKHYISLISYLVPQTHRESIIHKGMPSFNEGEPIFNMILL